MNYPIAMIPYANMSPYLEMGPPRGCYFVNCLPRNSIQALKSGVVWAAALPAGGLNELDGVVEPIGQFGIAAQGLVMSVLFFSDCPFDAFTLPRTVRLTDESASSVRLLSLLMSYRHGFEHLPACAPPGTPANGELVIGDTALQWGHAWESRGKVRNFDFCTDLAAMWDAQWQLPFVFARWVVRADAPKAVKRDLGDWLDGFDAREPALIERAVPKEAARLSLPEEYIRRYLKVIRRCLTDADLSGLDHFRREWQLHVGDRPHAWFTTGGKGTGDGGHIHA